MIQQVSQTTNTLLNGKLYDKLLVLLEGQALQHMVSWKHLLANGLLLLKELHQMYGSLPMSQLMHIIIDFMADLVY
jgi:uncharacterized protein (DUF952 family)